jgi:hypothetical protein
MVASTDCGSDLSSSLLQTPPPVSVYPNLPQTVPGRPKGRGRTTKDQTDDECSRCVIFALLALQQRILTSLIIRVLMEGKQYKQVSSGIDVSCVS